MDTVLKWNEKVITFNGQLIKVPTVLPPATWPTDEIKGRWDFSGSNLNDSINSNNGTVESGTMSYGTAFGSFKYVTPGASQNWFSLPSSLYEAANTDFSVSFWLNINGGNFAWSKGTDGLGNNFWSICGPDAGATNRLFFDNTGGYNYYTGLNLGSYSHVVYTYKASTKDSKIYVNNGTPTTNTHTQTTSGVNSYKWEFFRSTANSYYNGGYGAAYLALLYIYGKVLTASEVSQLYNSGNGI